MPWPEIVISVFEGQEIEDADGAGAQIRLLDRLASMMGGAGD